MTMQFSVLMSVYWKETASNLNQSLESIFNQTVLPDEVVLVKDGPLGVELDRTIDQFSARYSQLVVVKLPQNIGLGAALNEGLNYCSYQLIARMDSDDICLCDRFEKQLKVFERNPDIDIVGGAVDEFSTTPDKPESCRKVPENHDEIAEYFKHRSPMNHVTAMFKKQAVLDAGSYQSFYLLEDYWLWARMLENNAKFYNLPDVLVHARGGLAMSARRGGLKYAMSEMRLQKEFYKMGLVNWTVMSKNIVIRFIVRMMPSSLRIWFYQKILR